LELEPSVAGHYAHGTLEKAIREALASAGKDLTAVTPADLAPIDEFHIGGRQATADLAAQLSIKRGAHLLDIGSGLGGASRYFAHEYGCRVTGIDLTEDYVRTAEWLAGLVRLGGSVSYRQGSGLALPFPTGNFDGAYLLHVGMNVADKAVLFAEARRVLRPGGEFAIYDVMREKDGELAFPVPWATADDTSFVEGSGAYCQLLEKAGFSISKERSRRDFAIEFFRQMRARAAESGGPPPLGLHIVMGASAPQKVSNMIANLESGLIAPTEIIARAV
jgi:ubiquinone/menaquinone biosynthesis C-methylase UbiE